MKNLKLSALLIIAMMAFSSCSDDDDTVIPPVNEEELITTVEAVFTPSGGGTAITLRSRDLDGDGPGAPAITVNGSFLQNTTYNGAVTVLNESVSPAENITEEIIAEAEEHQLFYQKTGNLPNFVYATSADNLDANGKPIGLKTVFTTTSAATGTLTIILRHEPNKAATGVAGGDITNAAGSTDFEVTFSIAVQ